MKNKLSRILIAVTTVAALHADVKTEEKNQVKFEGMMGRMAGLFGGRAAREGTISTVALKGNRKVTKNEYGGQIIDLDEEKIYDLDFREKSYRVTTFAEMRRRMQEMQEKAARDARGRPGAPEGGRPDAENQMEIDFSMKESGQRRNINGHDCREVVMLIAVRQKGKTLEEAGGMVLTSNLWLGPEIPAMQEMAEFDRKYAEKMADVFGLGDAAMAQQMAAALAMYPGLKDAMERFQAENVNMEGTPILTVMTMQMAGNPQETGQQPRAENEDGGAPASVRGIGGLIGRRIGRQKKEEKPSEGSGGSGRVTFMTIHNELVKVGTEVAASDVAIPAGLRERK
jgi:hypothetical protein